jgi:hypothetical protein
LARPRPQFTAGGKQAIQDAQLKAAAAEVRTASVPPQRPRHSRGWPPFIPDVRVVGALIFLPIVTMFLSALYWALFNVVLGGTATSNRCCPTSSHSQVIAALGMLVGLPFMLMNPTAEHGRTIQPGGAGAHAR